MDVDTMFETGKIEHILAAIDNIVNGEVDLPPGEQTKLFERIREIGKGYMIVGTNYTYNSRNQLIHRDNLIRYEDYDYVYDAAGNLLTDGRSKYEWNAQAQLTKVTFPDGFGEKYTYDLLGRRVTKTMVNHQGETQQKTEYRYKGDTWVLTGEIVDGDGDDEESSKTYTYDANDRPLSITFKGETFWYVYNGHGDVMALTDKEGNVAARYEYDAWGLVTRMYNRYGERVREGIGRIGDLGTGNGSPGSVQGPEGGSGNTDPDYHPGNGNGQGKGNATDNVQSAELTDAQATPVNMAGLDELLAEEPTPEPTNDITTELVKENPIRFAGYYWDRKTQFYYLQARYYDSCPARFISEDSYEGEIENPQSLNLYTYAHNNPLKYIDPTGHDVLDAWQKVTADFKKQAEDAVIFMGKWAFNGYTGGLASDVYNATTGVEYFTNQKLSTFDRVISGAGAVTFFIPETGLAGKAATSVKYFSFKTGKFILKETDWLAKAITASKRAKDVGNVIKNKFPTEALPRDGKILSYTLKEGKIKGINGQTELDFVIKTNGKLVIGRSHHLLGNRGDVLAAGRLKLNGQGELRKIDNLSGHYQPTPSEAASYPDLFKRAGVNIKGAWLEIYHFKRDPDGYVTPMGIVTSRKL